MCFAPVRTPRRRFGGVRGGAQMNLCTVHIGVLTYTPTERQRIERGSVRTIGPGRTDRTAREGGRREGRGSPARRWTGSPAATRIHSAGDKVVEGNTMVFGPIQRI